MIGQATSLRIKGSEKIRQEIDLALSEGFSFALWKKPLVETVHLLVSESAKIVETFRIEESEPGFLISPFKSSGNKIFLSSDRYWVIDPNGSYEFDDRLKSIADPSTKISLPFYRNPNANQSYSVTAEQPASYQQLVTDCIHHIKSGKFEKIVPTRKKEIHLPEETDLLELFERLCHHYPNAMVSLMSSHLTGTWIGATPEPLVSIDQDRIFRTVALAGTQPYDPSTSISQVSWRQKEIEEQALVERYIINCLKKIRLREFTEVGPRTVQAGNLLHLRSDFAVDLNDVRFPDLGTVMLNLMHPTSAVCGMPLEPALEYLLKHEGYDREFYSGYLGPVNIENETHLFVNLRCMKWNGSTAWLYAGAGITADSDPAAEVKESEMKMDTLHRLIRKS